MNSLLGLTEWLIDSRFVWFSAPIQLLMSKKSPLVALTVLKKICDHPRLLSLRACHQLGMHGQGLVAVDALIHSGGGGGGGQRVGRPVD